MATAPDRFQVVSCRLQTFTLTPLAGDSTPSTFVLVSHIDAALFAGFGQLGAGFFVSPQNARKHFDQRHLCAVSAPTRWRIPRDRAAPMMTTDSGRLVCIIASQKLTTFSPSTLTPGIKAACER
jgi:hypothetical protein